MSERHTCASRMSRVLHVRVAPCCPTSASVTRITSLHVKTFSYAKMHGLYSVSWRDVTWQAKCNLGLDYHTNSGVDSSLHGHGGSVSSFQQISASIIQGSVIGPVSHVVNASELSTATPGNRMHKYSDDTYISWSRHAKHSTRLDTFDVSSPCVLVVSSLSNARLCTLDTTRSTRRAR